MLKHHILNIRRIIDILYRFVDYFHFFHKGAHIHEENTKKGRHFPGRNTLP